MIQWIFLIFFYVLLISFDRSDDSSPAHFSMNWTEGVLQIVESNLLEYFMETV